MTHIFAKLVASSVNKISLAGIHVWSVRVKHVDHVFDTTS